MRIAVVTAALIALSSPVSAGVTQDAFSKLVDGSAHVEVVRTIASGRGAATLLSTSDQRVISEVIAAIEFVDPTTRKTKNGEETITLPCFCVGEYAVTFTTRDGAQRLFSVKNSVTEAFPPELLGLSYQTDIHLSKQSTATLRRLIKRWEKRANKPVETTSLARPEIWESLPFATTPCSLSHG